MKFRLLKRLWGQWSPSDLLLITSYLGTGMAWSLPLRKALVIWIISEHSKSWLEKVK